MCLDCKSSAVNAYLFIYNHLIIHSFILHATSICEILLCYFPVTLLNTGFPGGSVGKESACNAGGASDAGSIPGLGRFPGGGHGNPPQYSCLENSHGQRSLVGCSPCGRKESDKTERLSTAQMLNTGVMTAYNSPH